MKPVMMKPEAITSNEVFYTVERNIYVLGNNLRYDITEMPHKIIGGELAKTFGHYHKGSAPEIYEVLEGHAYFLMQSFEDNPAIIKEVYAVEAVAGEKAVMLPNFGHLTINVGNGKLKMANWISLVDYDYDTYKNLHGGCYYVLDKGQNIEFEKNLNYKFVPELQKLRPKEAPELGIIKNMSLAELRKPENDGIKKLDWLLHPENYQNQLTVEKLYKKI